MFAHQAPKRSYDQYRSHGHGNTSKPIEHKKDRRVSFDLSANRTFTVSEDGKSFSVEPARPSHRVDFAARPLQKQVSHNSQNKPSSMQYTSRPVYRPQEPRKPETGGSKYQPGVLFPPPSYLRFDKEKPKIKPVAAPAKEPVAIEACHSTTRMLELVGSACVPESPITPTTPSFLTDPLSPAYQAPKPLPATEPQAVDESEVEEPPQKKARVEIEEEEEVVSDSDASDSDASESEEEQAVVVPPRVVARALAKKARQACAVCDGACHTPRKIMGKSIQVVVDNFRQVCGSDKPVKSFGKKCIYVCNACNDRYQNLPCALCGNAEKMHGRLLVGSNLHRARKHSNKEIKAGRCCSKCLGSVEKCRGNPLILRGHKARIIRDEEEEIQSDSESAAPESVSSTEPVDPVPEPVTSFLDLNHDPDMEDGVIMVIDPWEPKTLLATVKRQDETSDELVPIFISNFAHESASGEHAVSERIRKCLVDDEIIGSNAQIVSVRYQLMDNNRTTVFVKMTTSALRAKMIQDNHRIEVIYK